MSHRFHKLHAESFRPDYVPCCCDDDHEGDVQLHDGAVYQDLNGVPMTYYCAECADARVKREEGRFA